MSTPRDPSAPGPGPGRPFGRRDREDLPYRPPRQGEGGRVQTKVRLDPSLHRALHDRAAADGISVSAYIAQLVARDLGFPDPLADSLAQEELPLSQAS